MAAQDNKQRLINLIPKGEFEEGGYGKVLHWLLSSFRVIVILVEVVVVAGFASRFYLDTRNADLGDEIEQKLALLQSYNSFEQEFTLAQRRIEVYSEYANSSSLKLPLFNQVITSLPSGVGLVSMRADGPFVEVAGETNSEADIAQLIVNIEDKPEFDQTTLTRLETTSDSGVIEFTIRANLQGAVIEEET